MKDAGEAARGICAPVSAVLARSTGARSHKMLCQKGAKVYAAREIVIICRGGAPMRQCRNPHRARGPSVQAWRERRVCSPQHSGKLRHPGQSSTGWRTMNRHHAVAPRSGLAVCPGNWRLGQGRAGQRGRQLQAAGIQLAPVLDPVPFSEFLLASCAGRTILGCLLLRFLSRRQRVATGKRPAGMRRQSP